jgi:hypothetical protein
MEMERESRGSFRPAAIVGGVILLVVGTAALLDNTGALDVRLGRLIAPLVLIVLGASMMFDKSAIISSQRLPGEDGEIRMRVTRTRGGSIGGLWLIGIGAWMMVSQLHVWGLTYHTSWPLFIILTGLMTVIRGWR